MLHVEIISPDQTAFEGEADSVSLPTTQGEITVLPNHMPLMVLLAAGSVVIRSKGQEQLLAVSHGVVEVAGNRIRMLADTADRAEELEEEAIEKARAEAQRLMTEKRGSYEDYASATAMLERELARLKVTRRHRARRSSFESSSS